MFQMLKMNVGIVLEDIFKYCRRQTYNSCPKFDPTFLDDAHPPFQLSANSNAAQIIPRITRNKHPQQFRLLCFLHVNQYQQLFCFDVHDNV
uniref:Uncharacterized protein n=1 Tax=Panagrolaimus sp. PS1159 TaxID=55785 RepID=A0AC35GSN7_9BILA